jgi:transmembrane sensor
MTDRRSSQTEEGLRVPLSLELRDPVREPQVARMWSKIQARRTSARAPMRSIVTWAAVGALLGISVMLAFEGARSRSRHVAAVEPARDAGPLLLASKAPLQTVDVATGVPPRSVDLSDGSRIRVDSASHLEPLASSATEVVFRLAFGRAVFDVVPGGPRRWIVEAGIATVEVVGTRFGVTRSPERVHVDVERGVVLVRGATVPDGVARVEAGGDLDVPSPQSETPTPAPAASDNTSGHISAVPRARPPAAWRTSASGGRYAEAYAALGEGGVGRETARSDSADELLALADVARLSGHPAEAVEPLERILREHAASPGAPLAAVTLGRIQLGLNEPAEAARAFERALSLRVPAGLEEDIYARLVEARARAGDRAGAAAARREYERRFPTGRRTTDVLRWSHE